MNWLQDQEFPGQNFTCIPPCDSLLPLCLCIWKMSSERAGNAVSSKPPTISYQHSGIHHSSLILTYSSFPAFQLQSSPQWMGLQQLGSEKKCEEMLQATKRDHALKPTHIHLLLLTISLDRWRMRQVYHRKGFDGLLPTSFYLPKTKIFTTIKIHQWMILLGIYLFMHAFLSLTLFTHCFFLGETQIIQLPKHQAKRNYCQGFLLSGW